MARSCEKLFSYLDAAQVLTAAAPVLCVGGGIMMAFGSKIQYEHNYPYEDQQSQQNPQLKTIGWVLVGAGLGATIASAVLIGKAKRELSAKTGTLKLSAGPTGVGMIYTMP
jgi:hypothetical protein